ncbi:MAG TPA: peptidyl-prolyl cis-trans isomerase [Desulfohalobiaceae bacterium]|nr:peptidyl-prolyl cis-trans isomerase [Desulfohalobiaceae bacterium]
MVRQFFVWSAITFWLLIVVVTPVSGQLVNRIVAVVNGQIITLHDLQHEISTNQLSNGNAPKFKDDKQKGDEQKRFLKSMINDILLVDEAKRLKMSISDVEVKNRIQQLLNKQDISKEELKDILKKKDMSLDELKKRIHDNILKKRLLSSMVTQKVVVTEEDIVQYYNKHKRTYQEPESFHLKLMALKDKNLLKKFRDQIRKGQISFDKALKSSEISGSNLSGDLGFLAWKDLSQNWKEAVKDIQPGEVSHIFEIKDQYAFLYLESVRSEEETSLDEVRDNLRKKIRSQKLEKRFKEYIQKLRSNAVIEVRL